MMLNNNTDISEIIGADFNKKARAYQKDREKEQSSEYLQWQKEAAVYLRISSEMQKDGFSLEAQMRDCKKYIESVGYHLSDENIFVDEAFTAKNEKRPAFTKLIVSAHMGHFSLIVIHKSDRFERNLENQISTIKDLMKIGVTVYSCYEHKEITNDIYCQMMGMFNEHYINNLSDEVKKGKYAKIINEYMVPRSDEKKTTPLVPHYESKEDWTSCYPIRQIYIKDARSLIADKLMEKDCLIRLIDAGSFQPLDMIGHIQPDFALAVNRSRRKPFHWAFTLLPLPEDANETAVREEIRAWISKAIVYYYLGGKLDRISLIVDDEQIYSYALEEISMLHIKDEISVICISFLNRKILREYTLPVNSEKGNKTVPDLI